MEQREMQRLRTVEMLARQTSVEARAALSGYPGTDKLRASASLSRVLDKLGTPQRPNQTIVPQRGEEWRIDHEAGLFDGIEAELAQEAARAAGQSHHPQRPIIPWSMLAGQRDLTSASAPGGGYLTSTAVASPLLVLAPFSVVAKLATILPGLKSDLSIPMTTVEPTSGSQATEASAISASTPTLKSLAFQPHSVIALVEYSHQMRLQANALDEYLRRLLLGAIGRKLDVEVLQGSGASGEINGLVTNPDCTAIVGTSIDLDKLLTGQATAANADCNDESIAVLTTPNVRKLLGKREAVTGNGGFLWQGGRCAGMPGYVSSTMPSATAIIGDFANLIVGIFGAGIEIAVNEGGQTAADFKFMRGVTQVRALLYADAGARAPASFSVATSIT
jgi:HK97 family phage major capsid protein